MEWWVLLLIVAAVFAGPYLWCVRQIVKIPTPSPENEESQTVKETATTVLALVKTVERLDSEVEELKERGRRKA